MAPAASQEEIATEQVKAAEQQRVLGIFPNFYVAYDRNAVPLTTKLKFKLATKVAFDPVTFIGVGLFAGINQAGDVPDYGQGAQGYAKRYGAGFADGFTDIMIGGAILPALLHQDPRYFYQGTGTVKSRALHAIISPFVCRGDNGKPQPNYSTMGGDLASAAISNAYYPESNRGPGLVFGNFLIGTGERASPTWPRSSSCASSRPKQKSKLLHRVLNQQKSNQPTAVTAAMKTTQQKKLLRDQSTPSLAVAPSKASSLTNNLRPLAIMSSISSKASNNLILTAPYCSASFSSRPCFPPNHAKPRPGRRHLPRK